MGVVNNLGVGLTNYTATPRVLSNSTLTGDNTFTAIDVVASGAADSAASTYRFFKIASNAVINSLAMMNDANTSGTSYKAGLLLPAGGGVVVAGSDAILVPSGTSMASARSVWTELYFPAIAGNAAAAVNVTKRLWELLGLTVDPCLTYDVAITAVTAGSAGGNMAMKLSWSQ